MFIVGRGKEPCITQDGDGEDEEEGYECIIFEWLYGIDIVVVVDVGRGMDVAGAEGYGRVVNMDISL